MLVLGAAARQGRWALFRRSLTGPSAPTGQADRLCKGRQDERWMETDRLLLLAIGQVAKPQRGAIPATDSFVAASNDDASSRRRSVTKSVGVTPYAVRIDLDRWAALTPASSRSRGTPPRRLSPARIAVQALASQSGAD